jgi:dienelactone hydrolase
MTKLVAALLLMFPLQPPRWAPDRVIDQGTFALTVAGRRIGRESFQVVESGGERQIRTTAQLLDARGEVGSLRGTLHLDDQGRPRGGRFDWASRTVRKRMTLTVSPLGAVPELATENGPRAIIYTRPAKPSEFFALSSPSLVSHLYPLCQLAGAHERTLTAFPAAPLHLGAVVKRAFPQSRVGAPSVELTTVVVNLAQSARFELVCDGTRLVAVHQAGRALVATRASYEAVGSALEAWARSKPPVPETLEEKVVRVPAAGAALGCTLLARKPQGNAPPRLPAVVLLQDAGPHDRDGDPVGPGDPRLSLLKRLAIRLGEAGIASLRCDDRGAHGPVERAPHPSLQALAADAHAMLATLRKQPGLDPARVGIVGYGEGGLVAALTSHGERLSSLALLATPGRPLDVVVLSDTEQTLRRFGYPDDEIRGAVADQRAVYDAVRAGKPLPATLSSAERRAVTAALPWLRSHLALDLAGVWQQVEAPSVLIAQGEQDTHLGRQDFDDLQKALARPGKRELTARVYPDLTHPFAAAVRGSVVDHLDPRADISEPFLADVVLFERRALSRESAVATAPAGP